MTLKVSKKQADAVRVSRRQYDDYLGLWIDLPFSEEEVEACGIHTEASEKPTQGVQSIVGSLVADTMLFVCMLLSSTFLIVSLVPYINR